MRRSVLAMTAVSVLALSAAFLPAHAQTAEDLAIGSEVSGALQSGDAMTQGVEPVRHDDYRFTARQGQRVEAILRSDDFDAYLEIYRADGLDGAPLATDDDGLGEGVHSRLRFSAPDDGVYVLRARALARIGEGAYSLSLKERAPAAAAPMPELIFLNTPVQGTLDAATDPEQEEGPIYDAYVFPATAGERIAISLVSEAFDPVVIVGRADAGGDFVELARNDDAATGGLNSFLVFTAPEAGDYVVRATPLTEDGAGAYTLSMEPGPAPAPTRPISLGDTVNGSLSADDPTNDEGVRFDGYRFTGRAGQHLLIEMSSGAFDTYLALTGPTGSVVAQDDDGAGEGTNSRLTHILETDGEYVIQARAFGGGDASGDYRLKVEETAPPPPPQAIAFDAVVQGEIADGDPKDDEGRGYDEFVFSGAEGQRIQIIMRSGDFDTYLQISRPGGDFTALASDDDGLREGTDSRLIHTLGETGEYVVRASPLGSGADGLYSIEVVDKGPEPRAGSILIGSTARGTLTEADSISEDGSYFDAYRFHAKAGEELRITMVSNDFDAVLSIGEDSEGSAFEALVSDDDGLSDTHAKLEWTPETDGWYVIRARGLDQGQLGAYSMTVERKP